MGKLEELDRDGSGGGGGDCGGGGGSNGDGGGGGGSNGGGEHSATSVYAKWTCESGDPFRGHSWKRELHASAVHN